jgi:hypothetical protein
MRTRVKRGSSELALTRILDAFAQELIHASDEEILRVAKDLRMDPTTRESAAFAGVTYPARPQVSDFFDLERQKLQSAANWTVSEPAAGPKGKSRSSEQPHLSIDRKTPEGK